MCHNNHLPLKYAFEEIEQPRKTKIILDLRIGEPMQICIHRKDNSPRAVNHCLTLKEGPKVNSNSNLTFIALNLH